MPPLTALISWAHDSDAGSVLEDDGRRAEADRAWQRTVLDFTQALRVLGGVDADIDVAHASEAIDWARWGPNMARDSDFVIAVVNKAWSRRFDGDEAPTRGSGAVAEADVLLGIHQKDRAEFDRKVIPVVLPGASKDDLPLRLRGTTSWFIVPDFTASGLDSVLRRVHGKPGTVLLPVGGVPPLPPVAPVAVDAPADDEPASADSARPAGDDGARASRARGTAARPLAAVSDADLADRLDVVDSGLRSLPPDAADDHASLPWARARHGLQAQRAGVLAELDRRNALRPVAAPADRIAEAEPSLRRSEAAWFAVAAVPVLAVADEPVSVTDTRARLAAWTTDAVPVPPIDTTSQAHRDSGRVVFTGEPAAARVGDGTSGRWRIELADDGSTVVAAALPDRARAAGGRVGWAGQPGEVVLDADVALPVRRDAVEMWALTAVLLAGERLRSLADGSMVRLRAELFWPSRPVPARHRQPANTTAHVVDSARDPDAPEERPTRAPGSRDLPLRPLEPAELTTDSRELRAPASAVRTARTLAVGLLEQFGVEDTGILRPDGTIEPRAAAVADQQLVHQQARALGLPVDDLSPADRAEQARVLMAQARKLLAPPPPF